MRGKALAKRIITIAAVVIAIVAMVIILIKNSRVTLYSDESTTGNTSCNLLNGGFFAEDGDVIYFANPYDQNRMYKMKSDFSNVKRISKDNVSYINVAGKYIFYTRRNDKLKDDANALLSLSSTGLFRMDKSGANVSKLYDDPTQVVCLYGNYIYYQHYDQSEGLELYSAKIDGSTDTQLLDEAAAPYIVSNDRIYYTGWDNDHYIHSMSISGGDNTVLYEGNCTSLASQGNYLYYLDMNQNYALCRIGFDGSNPETIIADRLATYNVSEDGSRIYYQIDNGTSNGLYLLDTYSGTSELISSGNYNYLSLVSGYLFYETYDASQAFVYNTETGANQTFAPETD